MYIVKGYGKRRKKNSFYTLILILYSSALVNSCHFISPTVCKQHNIQIIYIKSLSLQDVSFANIWSNAHDGPDIPSLKFLLERAGESSSVSESNSPPFSCKLTVQQKGLGSQLSIKINSDFPYAPVTTNSLASWGVSSTGERFWF